LNPRKKKKQKDFFTLRQGRWRDQAHAPNQKKFFASFFQKRSAFILVE
jgi:hypothetical protein